jgi:hypothetical protein
MVGTFKIARSHFEGYLIETVRYPHMTIPEQDLPLHFYITCKRSNTLTGSHIRSQYLEGD